MEANERRRAKRRPITHVAHLATGLGPPLECRMSDVSEAGAHIAVTYPESAPQEFLVLRNVDLLRWCRVI